MLYYGISKIDGVLCYAQRSDLKYYYIGSSSCALPQIDKTLLELRYTPIGSTFLGEWNEM